MKGLQMKSFLLPQVAIILSIQLVLADELSVQEATNTLPPPRAHV